MHAFSNLKGHMRRQEQQKSVTEMMSGWRLWKQVCVTFFGGVLKDGREFNYIMGAPMLCNNRGFRLKWKTIMWIYKQIVYTFRSIYVLHVVQFTISLKCVYLKILMMKIYNMWEAVPISNWDRCDPNPKEKDVMKKVPHASTLRCLLVTKIET